VKAANIGLAECPHFGRLKLITQTGAETRIVVVGLVVVVVAVVVVGPSMCVLIAPFGNY